MRVRLPNQPPILHATGVIQRSYLPYLMLIVSALCIFSMFYFTGNDSATGKANGENLSVETSAPAQRKAPVPASAAFADKGTTDVSTIATDALTFYNLLSSSQQSTLQLTYTTSLARKWSNLPCGTSCRNGLQLGTNLTAAQYTAAMQIIKDALSSTANEGYDEFHQMNLAEAYLHANGGGSQYDSTLRWMAFLNTPSATGAWMLQFGGHHYAANIAFNNGHVIGATPFFMGLEPKTFTYNSVSYDPLGGEKTALANALASLSSSELSTAYISSSFSDCVMIPGETNGGTSTFPSASIGQALSSLTSTQQNLVLEAIKLYVGDMDAATYNAVIEDYTSDLSSTYISYHDANATAGSASSFFTDQGDYARISGPNVWIEFSCQGGVVIQGQIHYHTVWRDRSHDYGVDLTGDAIDQSSTLPVSLSEFKAVKLEAGNLLSWTTAGEANSKGFELFRSTDGSHYNSLATIASKAAGGNSSAPLTYSYEDKHPLAGTTYYKLAQVDNDGKTTYSQTVLIKRLNGNKVELISVYPNPARSSVNVVVVSPSSQKISVAVVDMNGKIVKQQSLLAKAGDNAIDLNVKDLPSGTYWVKSFCDNGCKATAQKFVKQ